MTGRSGGAGMLPPDAVELVSVAAMREGYDRAAEQLQPCLNDADCVLLAVLNGGLYPLMELLPRLHGDYTYDYCHATRYRGAREGGALHWERRPPASVAGRTVILLDDIFDIGLTLRAVADACRQAGASRVLSFVQVIKDTPARGGADEPDFTTGIRVPDRYVFGCGMDLDGRWRHLPAIYGLAQDDA